jgi:hypothetical protein
MANTKIGVDLIFNANTQNAKQNIAALTQEL